MIISLAAMLALASATPDPPAGLSRIHPVEVSASSFLKSDWNKYEENYHPYYAVDDDPNTAWVEGKADAGKGETLTLRTGWFPKAKRLRLVVLNGYQKSAPLLEKNAAPKTLTVIVAGAKGATSAQKTLTLERKMGFQSFELPLTDGVGAVTLRIDDAHPGSKWTDTCLSDVQLFIDGKVDVAVERAHAEKLAAWRKARLQLARTMKQRLAASDFASADFVVEREEALGDAGGCTPSPDAAALLAELKSFVGGSTPPEGSWVEMPPSEKGFTPDVFPSVDAHPLVTRAAPKGAKATKRAGWHRSEPDCGDCGPAALATWSDLFLQGPPGKATKALRGFRNQELYYEPHLEGGAAFRFDDEGRLDLAVGYLVTEYGGEQVTVVEPTWSPAGKIVRAVELDTGSCHRAVIKASK